MHFKDTANLTSPSPLHRIAAVGGSKEVGATFPKMGTIYSHAKLILIISGTGFAFATTKSKTGFHLI